MLYDLNSQKLFFEAWVVLKEHFFVTVQIQIFQKPRKAEDRKIPPTNEATYVYVFFVK